MDETQSIEIVYCPKCNRRVMAFEKRNTMPMYGKCSKCGRLVLKKPGEEPILKGYPKRNCASGCRFY